MEQWNECSRCDGTGVEVFGVTVYEHGCGFSHRDTEERPCTKCDGAGGWIGEAVDCEPPDPPGWEGGFAENH